MTGDSENEFGSAGDQPTPQDPVTGENSFRPFRSWASAYEPEPSLWTRLRAKLAGLFSRRQRDEPSPEREDAVGIEPYAVPTAHPDEVLDESLGEPQPQPDEEPVTSSASDEEDDADEMRVSSGRDAAPVEERQDLPWIDASPPPASFEPEESPAEPADEPVAAVSPPEDFRFPWSRPDAPEQGEGEGEVDSGAEPRVEVEVDGGVEAEPIAMSESAPINFLIEPMMRVAEEPKPGFFARLFGRKPKPKAPRRKRFDLPETESAQIAVAELDEARGVADVAVSEVSVADPRAPTFDEPVDAAVEQSIEQSIEIAAEESSVAELPVDARGEIESDRDAFAEPVEEFAAPPVEGTWPPASDPVGFVEQELASLEQSFSSVEDALPADAEAAPEPALEAELADEPRPAPAAKKPGFFARLFGRTSASVPEAPIEIPAADDEEIADTDEHNLDDAATAAAALDQVALDAFPPSEETPTMASDDAFFFPESEPPATAPAADEAFPISASEAPPISAEPELFLPEAEAPPSGEPVLEVSEEPSLLEVTESAEPIEPAEELPELPAAFAPLDPGAKLYTAFESVEEALPVSEEPPPPAPREKRPSFIGRLFARKTKETPRPSLEIEIHQDRIDAAAEALEEVHDETFAPSAEGVATDEGFSALDAALPSAVDEPPTDDLRFAPPADAEVASAFTLEADESRDTREIVQDQRDTREIVQDARNTLELTPPPDAGGTLEIVTETGETLEIGGRETMELVQEDRPTMEFVQESRPTAEITPPDFGDTLDVEQKTDEFEIPPIELTPAAADDGPDTLEVSKQSFIARLLGLKKKEKPGTKAATATVVEGNPVFLFSKFRAFYNEIIRFKHQKTEFTAGFSTAIVTDYAADLSPDAAAEAQSKKLLEMLELQAAEAKWMGGEAGERYPDAQYAMACLADELFSHMEWEGREAWPKHLIEIKLYKTHAADIEVFKRIDKLLKDKPNSHVARDLARVYLLVIAAGFQGKYRPFGLTRALADYRQRLYEYIHSGDALMLYAEERKIFPEAVSATLEGHAVSRFTAAQRWAAILIFLVVGYTVMAHVAWNRVSADLKDVTARIRSGSTTGSNGSGGR